MSRILALLVLVGLTGCATFPSSDSSVTGDVNKDVSTDVADQLSRLTGDTTVVDVVAECQSVCDGIDSGSSCAQLFCADADEDGWNGAVNMNNIYESAPGGSMCLCVFEGSPPEFYDAVTSEGELGEDCNDNDAAINPDATEVCDGADNNCDGMVDDGGDAATWYLDTDGDNYGMMPFSSCTQPPGYVAMNGDCDDTDEGINPGAMEVCDGWDNDCDGWIDADDASASGFALFFEDSDGDGYGNAWSTTETCFASPGWVTDDTDCDDTDEDIYPGATETCNDMDDDCDGLTDDADTGVTGQSLWYDDDDGDGYGSMATAMACSQPSGYVSNNTDCDDSNGSINPSASEVCDASNTDEDCDGGADDADPGTPSGEMVWYADTDGDTYGNPLVSTMACDQPEGYVADWTDCNDSSNAAYPGATEMCDAMDNDCDGSVDEDACTSDPDTDGDGYADSVDCDDTNAAINPGATEVWYDGVDQNCDGESDYDQDGDGYDSDTDMEGGTDCNDTNMAVNPGASDIDNDGLDNDCDGSMVDEVCVTPVAGVDTLSTELYIDDYTNSPNTLVSTGIVGVGQLCAEGIELVAGNQLKINGEVSGGAFWWVMNDADNISAVMIAGGTSGSTSYFSWNNADGSPGGRDLLVAIPELPN